VRSSEHILAEHGEKLTAVWGERQAREVWDDFLSKQAVDWKGKTVLDFGCYWGHVGMQLLSEQDVGAVHGVDIEPVWEWLTDGTRPAQTDNLHLHEGNLLELPELQDQRFDIVVSTGTLMLIPPTELRQILGWFLDHLEPGGDCLIDTRTFFSPLGADLHKQVNAPLPHLLFSRRIIADHLERHARGTAAYTNPFCAATYLTLYRRVGFEIVSVDRVMDLKDDPVYDRFADKLSMYERTELMTSRLQTHLRKPAEPEDLSGLLRDDGNESSP
jgi:2-polyprenyl-3-methyl-5-hydroxy-6-metoxy-1,4-benzoquinol methylase